MPIVSVLIPLYNAADFIEAAIESVLGQSYVDFELIIVDNCSTDDGFNRIQHFKSDPRVSIYQNASNIGMARNWNQCLLYAKGKYIKFLCADDYFEPHALSEYVQIMNDYPNVSLVFSPRTVLNLDGSLVKWQPYRTGIINGGQLYKDIVRFDMNPLGEPTYIMFRKSDINAGLFNPDYGWITDIDLWLNLILLGDAYGLSNHCAVFRIHESQTTMIVRKANRDFLEERMFLEYNYFTRNSELKGDSKDYFESLLRFLKRKVRFRQISLLTAIQQFDHVSFFTKLYGVAYMSLYFVYKRLRK